MGLVVHLIHQELGLKPNNPVWSYGLLCNSGLYSQAQTKDDQIMN